ncbi:MAG: glycine dehydrogenase subunit 2 [Magnetococcales bacterium]|nr:aminomethyl-transferring glycine dehydrogenase subunit GcvPB [Magnetococcales bacterium]NGZ06062.1 glycine dehydrogenase subunit 2 [Magnetococcales bacterium]
MPDPRVGVPEIPSRFLRAQPPQLPQLSELQVVRHFTRLSQLNFSVDTQFYPLGSCTMKYNPRICQVLASLPGFVHRHPLAAVESGQGVLRSLFELQEMLGEIAGMPAVSLVPMAGAQGEFAGVAMIRAYHRARGEDGRREMLIPDAAHGTNPATATMCGCTVREIPTNARGDVDLEALARAVGPRTAGLMLTNPSTLGVFERQVARMAEIVHAAGGLLYYDGANLNAVAGRVRPGDMGFDAVHFNVHKTFATPHGGGGPGAGPVAVASRLAPFLPLPVVKKEVDESGRERFSWLDEADLPSSMGRLSTFAGNIGVLLRAHVYLRMIGAEGLQRVSDMATLNANYLMARLCAAGFTVAFPGRRATHEFILTLKPEADAFGVTALDFAKRLLEFGIHAPTIYFPALVPECFLIEPTETETRETLDQFVEAMIAIRHEAATQPQRVLTAPQSVPVAGGGIGRLDATRAARKPDLIWKENQPR